MSTHKSNYMNFSFYDGILYDNSIISIKERFLNSEYPDGMKYFNSSDEHCFNFITDESGTAILKISKWLETELLCEQTNELRQFKLEYILSLIQHYIEKLKGLDDDKMTINILCDDLHELLNGLRTKYSSLAKNSVKANAIIPFKIQWLGKTNVLATLFYDLWKGQDKGKGKASTPPMMKADKKDLEKLLIDNFIDSKGEPLTIATISDYLNTSKPEKRAKNGSRIEL